MAGLSFGYLPLALLAGPALSAATKAGTRITNVARLELPGDGTGQSTFSNQVDLLVGEMLDVVLSANARGATEPVGPGGSIPFSLTNAGNGPEAFDVAVTFDGGSATVRAVAIDLDGDGRFDPANDRVLDGGRTPVLAGGAMLQLLAIVDPATAPGEATVLTVTARCITGNGVPGTVFDRMGDGGSDAVVGATGAMARLVLPLAGGVVPPSLVKTQSVRAIDGSSNPSVGAIVTYRLEARFPGPAAAARVLDAIPDGTAYVPGSLRLDTLPLSDARDADGGRADARGIEIVLGDIAAAATHVIQFQVSIQ